MVTNHGTGAQTAVPTISFSGGGGTGAVATAIMDWTITAYSATGAGVGYTAPVQVTGFGGQVGGTAVNTNPLFDKALVTIRQANIQAALSATAITATGAGRDRRRTLLRGADGAHHEQLRADHGGDARADDGRRDRHGAAAAECLILAGA